MRAFKKMRSCPSKQLNGRISFQSVSAWLNQILTMLLKGKLICLKNFLNHLTVCCSGVIIEDAIHNIKTIGAVTIRNKMC